MCQCMSSISFFFCLQLLLAAFCDAYKIRSYDCVGRVTTYIHGFPHLNIFLKEKFKNDAMQLIRLDYCNAKMFEVICSMGEVWEISSNFTDSQNAHIIPIGVGIVMEDQR